MFRMQAISSIRKDFIATHLRAQINSLRGVLNNIENDDAIDCDYTLQSIKEIENNLRQARKICEEA